MKAKIDLTNISHIFKRSFAAQQPKVAHRPAGSSDLNKQGLQRTALTNGIVVASVENLSPASKVAVYVRAGSRYETSKELGSSHLIRYAAGMHTKNFTIFGITRNIEYSGGSMTATSTRDDIVYKLCNMREASEQNFAYLADTVTRPAFKFWQLQDYIYRAQLETARAQADPEQVMMEELHRIAFRGGLSNPLYCSTHVLEHHDSDTVAAFHDRMFRNKRIAVVGVGVDHSKLVEHVEELFESRDGAGPQLVKSKFIGGESRISMEPERDITVATVVTEGVGTATMKDHLALGLFQNILSPGVRVKYGSGSSKLVQGAKSIAKGHFNVVPVNISYIDTGLFGFSLKCQSNEAGDLIKALVHKMRETAKTLKEEDLVIAKKQAKAALWLNQDCSDMMMDRIGQSLLNDGSASSVEEVDKMIDSITLKDVSNLAGKIVKSKGALVAVGNLDNVCYLEDLVA